MDACSRADLDGVLKVLDSTLVHPRLSLEETTAQEAAAAAATSAAVAAVRDDGADIGGTDPSTGTSKGAQGRDRDRHGKQRQSSVDLNQNRHDSIGTGSEAKFLEESLVMSAMEISSDVDAGVGTSSPPRTSVATNPSRDRTLESTNEVPTVIHRASLFHPRSRVSSDGGCTNTDSSAGDNNNDEHNHPISSVVRSNSDILSGSDNSDQDPPPHMPWIDGRALTSALLAVCFRRNGYESPEAEHEEELRAVPIVRELLKYDCMLTAQSMGQAVLGVAYSRPTGSLKRTREQRLSWRRQKLQSRGRRQSQSVGGSSSQSRRDSVAQQGGGAGSSSVGDSSSSAAGGLGGVSATMPGQRVTGMTETIMDLLLERIGPREWLKLIKCYLQRQEFDDLAVVLERCPFKGPQLETRNKEKEKNQQQRSFSSGGAGADYGHPGVFTYGAASAAGGVFSSHHGDHGRQRAREMICRETGICGVGTRIGHFNGRGAGQASYNVASTLYDSSRTLFTGSGTRFSHSYMLPRGGFRGIGGNSSGHTGSPSNSTASHVVGSADESVHAVEEESYMSSGGGGERVPGGDGYHQTPPSSGRQQWQEQQHLRSDIRDQHQQSSHQYDNAEEERDTDDGDDGSDSDDSDGPTDSEQDDPESHVEQFESHDSNFAFGGVGSSTTSSSRPGPGIVGIAIQVQAPEHILNLLLKMGFRFFSICDLSISDSRHPLALQFRQQEKVNRQLIEFCMVPNLERLGDGIEGGKGNGGRSRGSERKGGKGKGRKFEKRDESRYDEADREAHAQVVQLFLYPAANNPTRGWSSIPALPSMVSSISQRISTSAGGGGNYYSNPPSPSTPTHVAPPSISAPSSPSPAAVVTVASATRATYSLTPSNQLQFILPPIQLGDSFESISTVVKFADQNPEFAQPSSSRPATVATTSNNNENNSGGGSPSQSTLTQARYRQAGFATSMPLPIRTSMVEKRLSAESSFFALHSLRDSAGNYLLPHSPSTSSSTFTSTAPNFSIRQRMLQETIRRRVRETLSSDYMDLMTVGICLYQACYHAKEFLLTVLLEHRLLIAQDALTGAVQVAASVGWKRGLELLLVQCGDMEAEIEPVVTTTSEAVHSGTSMKWDHATAVQVFPSGRRSGEAAAGGRASLPGSLGARRGARIAATGGLEGLVTRGLRRHRSDGGRLDRFRDGSGNGGFFDGSGGVSYVSGDASNGGADNGRPVELNRRASFELSHTPMFQSGGVLSSSPTEETPSLLLPVQNPLLDPVIPSARSSSLRSKLSSLIPNLGVSSGSTTDLSQKPNSSKNKQSQQQSSSQQHHSTWQASSSALLSPSTKNSRPNTPPTILMLSTSGLWSLPSVMMQRKSRNAVVALMAACTRNDPRLVTWLVETFADIKVVHVMQALMIACDRGLVRVVKALIGEPLVAGSQGVGGEREDVAAGKRKAVWGGKKKKDRTSQPAATMTSRSLFRRWLAFQYQQIIDMSTQPTSSSSLPNPPAGSGVTEYEGEHTKADAEASTSITTPRYDSFPFVFLMESSPLFRHYYQTLNTLSSCQFMLKRGTSTQPSGGPGVGGTRGSNLAPPYATTATSVAGSPHISTGTRQQQQHLSAGHDSEASSSAVYNDNDNLATGPSNSTPPSSTPPIPPQLTPLQRRASAHSHSHFSPSHSTPAPPRPTTLRPTPPPQDLKKEIIGLLLAPVFETFGAISVRKAMDRLPKDCWWPLDHDVRIIVDQEARKEMVAVVVGMKREQRQQRQRQRAEEDVLRVSKAMRERVGAKAQEDKRESSGGRGVGGLTGEEEDESHNVQRRHGRQASRMADLWQMSEQKRKERQKKRGDRGGSEDEPSDEQEDKKKKTTNDKWHKASGPFRRVRKWVVERRKNKSLGKECLEEKKNADVEDGEEEVSGVGGSGSVQSSEKSRPFNLTSTRPGLTIVG
ncbi:hypothetical protein EC991_005970 [Linnemannia zychae]|nr:hypothetical protein EC991_005970 [Linnemannia zychae]